MERSRRSPRRDSSSRLGIAFALSSAASIASCVSLVSLEHRSCPCAEGWVCCEATDTCLRPEEACRASGKGGDGGGGGGNGGTTAGRGGADGTGGKGVSGASGASGTSGSSTGGSSGDGGQGGDTGGVSGSAGLGGAPEPEWHPVGPEVLEEPRTTSEPHFVLAPDGTPYLAFRGCGECGVPSTMRTPIIERFDGSRWRALPTDGLPANILASPELAIGGDGALHVLIDGQVSSFDGDVWQSRMEPLPEVTTLDSNFQVDAEGTFWATIFDGESGEISVVRTAAPAGSSWENVGAPVPGDPSSVRLVLGNEDMFLAHLAADRSHVFVRQFNGSDWLGDELAGESVDVAQAPDGSLFATTWRRPFEVTLYTGTVGSLTSVGTMTASFAAPALRYAEDGSLFCVYLSDGFVNVNCWDGMYFQDVQSDELGTGTSPVLRLFTLDERLVPYVAFEVGAALEVKKYE